jgi:TaqI-like C-terminal specificity domain/N-6 DNA Methylase
LDDITVIDPAGGSGAFLNQVHTFLTIQHANRIKENISQVFTGSNMDKGVEFNLNKNILNNNLFMVDLQPESVEIAKLSLWLKTARVDEKLNNLDQNIKCGNSLVSDKIIGGELALNWNKEFPNIMKNRGFDIIVGNPPWVFARDQNFDDRTKDFYLKNYKLCNYQINTYLLFIEKSYSLLKVNGYLGFVLPNTWMTISTFEPLRKFILENTADIKVLNIMYKAFEDASVDCSILIFKKSKSNTIQFGEFSKDSVELFEKVDVERVNKDTRIFNISEFKNIKNTNWVDKLENNSLRLNDLAIVKSGLVAYEVGKGNPIQTEEMKNDRIYHSNIKFDESWSKYLEGSDVNRYELNWNNNFIQYGKNLAASRDVLLYNQIRILVRQIPSQPPFSINACLVEENMMINDRNSMIITSFKNDPNYILGCLNSKILSKWFLLKFDKLQRGLFPQFKVNELAQFPIPKATDIEQEVVAELVKELIQNKQHIKKVISDTLVSIFYELGIKEGIINILKKDKTLLNFMNLEFSKFSEELSKKNIVIMLSKRATILEYFNEQKLLVNNQLKSIDNLDQNIEKLVSQLYGAELVD